MEKTIKTFAGLKAGTRIKVVKNSNSHSYPLNRALTLKQNGCGITMTDAVEEICGNSINASDCILIGGITIKDMQEEIRGLEEQINCLKEKIKACEDLELTEYDDTYFRVYRALNVLKGSDSDKEKTKIITDIIKNCQ